MKILQRSASILLLACLFLPLSKCTAKKAIEGNVTATDTYVYAYKMAGEAITEIKSGNILHGIAFLLSIFIVFVLPLACIKLRKVAGAALLLVGSFMSAYPLYGWIFVFGDIPQVGGVIAIACWSILFVTAIYEIGLWLFNLSFKDNGSGSSFRA